MNNKDAQILNTLEKIHKVLETMQKVLIAHETRLDELTKQSTSKYIQLQKLDDGRIVIGEPFKL
ncbi:MAG: hypothetical protein IPJ03_16625 [Ignavibacteriales bacterium]|nr:hypothetical protein [Ignavibacteriales bacterium]